MAHKTLVNGTEYAIAKGVSLVDGTGYAISKGRTLVDGTGYDIEFIKKFKLTVKTESTTWIYSAVYLNGESLADGTYTVTEKDNLTVWIKYKSATGYMYFNGSQVAKVNQYEQKTFDLMEKVLSMDVIPRIINVIKGTGSNSNNVRITTS